MLLSNTSAQYFGPTSLRKVGGGNVVDRLQCSATIVDRPLRCFSYLSRLAAPGAGWIQVRSHDWPVYELRDWLADRWPLDIVRQGTFLSSSFSEARVLAGGRWAVPGAVAGLHPVVAVIRRQLNTLLFWWFRRRRLTNCAVPYRPTSTTTTHRRRCGCRLRTLVAAWCSTLPERRRRLVGVGVLWQMFVAALAAWCWSAVSCPSVGWARHQPPRTRTRARCWNTVDSLASRMLCTLPPLLLLRCARLLVLSVSSL